MREVERLAKMHGPGSVAAEVWAELSSPPDQIRPVLNIWHWASDPPVAASKSEYLSVLCPLCADEEEEDAGEEG